MFRCLSCQHHRRVQYRLSLARVGVMPWMPRSFMMALHLMSTCAAQASTRGIRAVFLLLSWHPTGELCHTVLMRSLPYVVLQILALYAPEQTRTRNCVTSCLRWRPNDGCRRKSPESRRTAFRQASSRAADFSATRTLYFPRYSTSRLRTFSR